MSIGDKDMILLYAENAAIFAVNAISFAVIVFDAARGIVPSRYALIIFSIFLETFSE